MADQDVYDIYTASPATAKSKLIIYVVDTDESTEADQDKALLWGDLVDSIITYDGQAVVKDGNIVVKG